MNKKIREYDLPPVENLETRMKLLGEMKAELREKNNAYSDSVKDLKESIKSLENIIADEIVKGGKTVTIGNLRAEFVPQVKFKLKKVNDGK